MNNHIHPETMIGGKMPPQSLWSQLQSAGCTLEFCSQYFAEQLSHKEAQAWLLKKGIKISVTALSGFYSSMEMRMRYAVMQSEALATLTAEELPEDIEQATRERIKQAKFELSFANLSERQKLQLVQLQQNEDAARGSYELKKGKLDLDRLKYRRDTLELFVKWYEDQRAKDILNSPDSYADRIKRLHQLMFPEDQLGQSGKAETLNTENAGK
jgi:hypothetical protein